MNMLDWAKNEVKIACEIENLNRKEGEFDYGCSCYESALKAYENLIDDGHSGFSIKFAKLILNRLIDGKPLTPIEDTDDIWYIVKSDIEAITYQCKRMSSLFKDVYSDGSIKYADTNRVYCVDINNLNSTYSCGLVGRIIDEMFPITMPYMPEKPIKVFCEDFLTDKKNGDFDTVGIFYAFKEENGEPKNIKINRFFREPILEKGEYVPWIEISKEEYYDRKSKKL